MNDPYQQAREHQALIRANIEAAENQGHKDHAEMLRIKFHDLLKLELPPVETPV